MDFQNMRSARSVRRRQAKMFMNCHVLDNTIGQDQWRVNWSVYFRAKKQFL